MIILRYLVRPIGWSIFSIILLIRLIHGSHFEKELATKGWDEATGKKWKWAAVATKFSNWSINNNYHMSLCANEELKKEEGISNLTNIINWVFHPGHTANALRLYRKKMMSS